MDYSRFLNYRSFGCHVKKVSSYIAQYPVLRPVQSALQFTSLAELFNQPPSQLLWDALMCEGSSYKYPPLSIAI